MKRKRWISFLVSFITLAVLAFSLPQPAYTASKKKLTRRNKTLTSKKQEAKNIQKDLKQKKEKVKEVIKKERSILSRIENIDKNVQKKQAELKKYDRQISKTESKISSLSEVIGQLDGTLNRKKGYLRERLRTLYKQKYGNYALTLVSADDYQDLIRRSKYISLAAYHDSKIVRKYRDEIAEITSRKKDMEELQSTLKTNKDIVQKKNKELQADRTKKDKLLAAIRNQRSTYEKTISELEESSKNLQNMIRRLKRQSLPNSVTGKGITASRGHLPWPVSGKVLIPFGKYMDPKFKITVFKNGVEIRVSPGETPKAVASGRVVYSDWFKGYGLLLIINHGKGYHSLYGNLSEIFHKTGDIINEGTAVGNVGNSSIFNVPTLYFEIRYKGKPIDPVKWLKKKHKARY
ncbi:murein hydrolase activator EnvC precursor [bacterium BMS3Abin09]|nr:murein hydrolase activator EnvC precursor [bacterium BMS3Abin09]GBE41851.1 murein hydrolase activator EnvC precursor [bacterium BMS3Bbin09]